MVTILIIAHEEEEKLSRNLPFLLSQQCTDYEVVVVDMNSEDNTIEILNALEAEYRHLRHISLPKSAKDISRERLALHLGVRTANTDRVIIIGAGMIVPNNEWIADIEKRWRPDSDIILIPVIREKTKGFLNSLYTRHEAWRKKLHLQQAHKHQLYSVDSNVIGLNKNKFLTHISPFEHLALKTGTLDIFTAITATSQNTTLIYEKKLFPFESPIENLYNWKQMRLFDVETRKHLPNQFKRHLTYLTHCICTIHFGSILYTLIDLHDYIRWRFTRKKTFMKKHY